MKKILDNFTPDACLEYSFAIFQSNNPIDIAIGRIRTLSMYGAGWDGENSIGADEQTVYEAEELIRIIFKYNVHKPIISLANDGEINFYWNFDGSVLDLGVFGDGCYSYYFRSKDGKEIFVDGRPISFITNDEVLDIIISSYKKYTDN